MMLTAGKIWIMVATIWPFYSEQACEDAKAQIHSQVVVEQTECREAEGDNPVSPLAPYTSRLPVVKPAPEARS